MSEQETGMVRGEKTRTIGGRTYTTRPLPGRVGFDLMARMISYAGEDIVTLMFAVAEDKRNEALGNAAIQAKMIHEFCSNAIASRHGTERPTDILFELMASTTCDQIQLGDTTIKGNVQKHFDSHFAGDYSHLMEVVQFVGEVNFAGP